VLATVYPPGGIKLPEIHIPDFDKVSLQPPQLDCGTYTVNVQEKPTIESQSDGKQYIQLQMVVMGGPAQKEADPATGNTSPVGRKWRDRLYLVDGAYFRVKALLIAAGILARDDKASAIAMGNFNSDLLVGTKFQIRLDPNINPQTGKEYRNVVYIT
jgi:hypothetical protein